MKLTEQRFKPHYAINLLKKFRRYPITQIIVRGFYNDQPIYGKIAGKYKLMFELYETSNALSLRFYENDIQRTYTTITISKKEIELMKRVFEAAKNGN